MKSLNLFLAVFLLQLNFFYLKAQNSFNSPYTLTYKFDAPLATAGVGLNLAYFLLDRKSEALQPAFISTLDRSNINAFDRSAAYNWSRPAAKGSDVLMIGAMAAPSLLFFDKNIRNDYYKIGTIWAQTMALNTGVTNLTKVLVKRTRPYVYNPNAPEHYKLERDARYSFFSGHTSVTASMSFMTAKIFSDYNPSSKALPYVWTTAAVVPATVAFLRWRAGKHYASDVIVGYLTGAAIGFLVPHLHKIIR
jgi:membrane-associated phospholipid phosphatase